MKILEMIEEWRSTICQTSRYKQDLGFIRDMHRLLSYKGYIFPEVRREDAAVLNPSDNLQSADEMEQEERAAQSAKLQELIRRGGPEDLQEANRLMKIMAGYDTKHKTDYRAKAADEVGKIQQKARLLEERLQNFKAGDEVVEGDIFEELANALQSAQPKIQKMCEEESEDSEAVAKLLEINDSIHRTIERYKLTKKGDLEAASKIPKGTLGTSTGVTKTANDELSLIDFSGDESGQSIVASGEGTSIPKPATLQDDLLGLSIQDEEYGQGGGIALGFGANTSESLTILRLSGQFLRFIDVPGPTLLSSTVQQSSAKAPISSATPQVQQVALPSKPNYDPFSSLTGSGPSSRSATPAPSTLLQSQNATIQQMQSTDPFAAVSRPRQSQPQVSNPSSSAIAFNPAQSSHQQPQLVPNSRQTNDTALADDDWNFASALPDDTLSLPVSNDLRVSDTSVTIVFHTSRTTDPEKLVSIRASFLNNTNSPITDYVFQVAVNKVQTSRSMS